MKTLAMDRFCVLILLSILLPVLTFRQKPVRIIPHRVFMQASHQFNLDQSLLTALRKSNLYTKYEVNPIVRSISRYGSLTTVGILFIYILSLFGKKPHQPSNTQSSIQTSKGIANSGRRIDMRQQLNEKMKAANGQSISQISKSDLKYFPTSKGISKRPTNDQPITSKNTRPSHFLNYLTSFSIFDVLRRPLLSIATVIRSILTKRKDGINTFSNNENAFDSIPKRNVANIQKPMKRDLNGNARVVQTSKSSWTPCKLVEVSEISFDDEPSALKNITSNKYKRYIFRVEDDVQLAKLKPGQLVQLCAVNARGDLVKSNYFPRRFSENLLEVVAMNYANLNAFAHRKQALAHLSLSSPTSLGNDLAAVKVARPPRSTVAYNVFDYRGKAEINGLTIICSGLGIIPVISLLKKIVEDYSTNDRSKGSSGIFALEGVDLLWINENKQDFIFNADLQQLEDLAREKSRDEEDVNFINGKHAIPVTSTSITAVNGTDNTTSSVSIKELASKYLVNEEERALLEGNLLSVVRVVDVNIHDEKSVLHSRMKDFVVDYEPGKALLILGSAQLITKFTAVSKERNFPPEQVITYDTESMLISN